MAIGPMGRGPCTDALLLAKDELRVDNQVEVVYRMAKRVYSTAVWTLYVHIINQLGTIKKIEARLGLHVHLRASRNLLSPMYVRTLGGSWIRL